MSSTPIPVVVMDRDGTLIEDRHYIKREEDVVFYPGAFEALRLVKEKGYATLLVSNQSGVGRKWIAEDEFRNVHRKFTSELSRAGLALDEIAYCFHHPDENCPCRKPKTGLLPPLIGGRSIDWSRSYVVGDHFPDVNLAAAIGARPCLVRTGKGKETEAGPLPTSTQVFDNILEFVRSLPPVNV